MEYTTLLMFQPSFSFECSSRVVSYGTKFDQTEFGVRRAPGAKLNAAAYECGAIGPKSRKSVQCFDRRPRINGNCFQDVSSRDCQAHGKDQKGIGRANVLSQASAQNKVAIFKSANPECIGPFDVSNDVLVLQCLKGELCGSKLTLARTWNGASINLGGRVVSVVSVEGKPIPLNDLKNTIKFAREVQCRTDMSTAGSRSDSELSQFIESSELAASCSELQESAKNSNPEKLKPARAVQGNMIVNDVFRGKISSAKRFERCENAPGVFIDLGDMFAVCESDEFVFK